MQEPLFDFSRDDEFAGFRLERLELYNWGTFDKKVWALDLDSQNCLLTGDIGSGKSTIVDAVTTLLVPSHRIAFNKAAGAEKKERSLRSYVLGFYKTERSGFGNSATPVALRGHNTYSVVLGVFFNKGYNQKITLAQVFWCKDNQGQPDKYFVVAKHPLSISKDFTGFGSDLGNLRKRLRGESGVETFDSFKLYSAEFRRQFGIKNEQALELFHQTVSMKSVGNLTEFVQEHMLESFDVESDIAALIGHFNDLNRAHQAVLKTKKQILQLTPLVEDYKKFQSVSEQKEYLCLGRESLHSYFSALKAALLEKRLQNFSEDTRRLHHKIDGVEKKRHDQHSKRDSLKQAILENGGERLEQLKSEIAQAHDRKKEKKDRAARYNELTGNVGLSQADSLEAFIGNSSRLQGLLEAKGTEANDLQDAITADAVQLDRKREEHATLSGELSSLSKRHSNISSKLIHVRRELCESLNIDEESMPFVGELLQVKEGESHWEGAAERVLHNFGLSLLVPEEHYTIVSEYVDKTHLQGRLVYYRVRLERNYEKGDYEPKSLVYKLAIKGSSRFYGWLESELVRRFNYRCCDDFSEFRREQQALTVAGQIKSGGLRHEKDDRHAINDRRRYILGWSNKQKIGTITADLEKCEQRIQEISGEITIKQKLKREADDFLTQLNLLGEFTKFNELDWRNDSLKIDDLTKEKKSLEASSNVLAVMADELKGLEVQIVETEDEEKQLRHEYGLLDAKQGQACKELEQCLQNIKGVEESVRSEIFLYLDSVRQEVLGEHSLAVESCFNREQDVRVWLQGKIDGNEKQTKRIGERITAAMHQYCTDFPAETQEVDARIEAAFEYQQMLEELQADNLPKYEQKFKELLNQNTIREVVHFKSLLDKQKQRIRERIEQINLSLSSIEYNPGRYIELENAKTVDQEIREFQQQLRACTEDSIFDSGEEQYAENKFFQVSQIIERFRGRENLIDLDKKWVRKVTDVRNWFTFAASERYQENGDEYEHYTDTGGKSGGQKEKLAYTVLAASIVYQFGLERGEVKSRSFRFVVIDEAFGRGSDESTRYALRLFQELNLQLLIVTPLQKIHIIEPYVSSVGFVHNDHGQDSQLRNLTIQEYREGREARAS